MTPLSVCVPPLNQVMSNILVSLKKRPPPPSTVTSSSHPSLGIQSKYLAAQAVLLAEQSSPFKPEIVARFVLSPEDLVKWTYLVEIPAGQGGDRPTEEGKERQCNRCDKAFIVPIGGISGTSKSEGETCWHHHGRKRWGKDDGIRAQIATCCGGLWTSQGCTTSRSHVFKEEEPDDLHARVAYLRTEDLAANRKGKGRRRLNLVGCDCEMIYTTAGMSLARVTLVDERCEVVFDEHVRVEPASILYVAQTSFPVFFLFFFLPRRRLNHDYFISTVIPTRDSLVSNPARSSVPLLP